MKTLVIGGATIDVIVSINPEDIEYITMRNATHSYLMMEQGKKVDAAQIETMVGGGASNAAVAMARLGAEVSCLLKLGDDSDADLILQKLQGENIDTRYVLKEKTAPTGKSIIVCSHDRNAGVFVNRGANKTLSEGDIEPKMFDGLDLVYVATLSSKSADVFEKLVTQAKSAGAFVACNPGIRQIRSRRDQLIRALKKVDLLALNAEEAAALAEGLGLDQAVPVPSDAKTPRLYHQGLGSKDHTVSLNAFAEKVLSLGCSHLVITDGAEGAYLCVDNAILFRPALPASVASTIGAGDAFNATIAKAIAGKHTVWNALNMAAVNASAIAGCLDTQSALMTMDQIQKRTIAMDSARILSFPIKDIPGAA